LLAAVFLRHRRLNTLLLLAVLVAGLVIQMEDKALAAAELAGIVLQVALQ
jgi:hypothetical protein